jgi:hypothetical protein
MVKNIFPIKLIHQSVQKNNQQDQLRRKKSFAMPTLFTEIFIMYFC